MKKRITYLFFFTSVACLSQTKLDSLNKLVLAAHQDTEKVKALLQISLFYGSNDPEKSLEYSVKAVAITEKPGYDHTDPLSKKIAASANRSSGVACYFLGNYSQALKILQRSLMISEAINDKVGSSNTYGWIGNTYYSKGDFEKALQNLLSSLKLQEELGNKTGIAGSLNGIANIYHIRHEFSKALEYYFKSLEMRKELDNIINVAYVFNNIGLVYAEADSLDKSLFYHLKCLQIVKQYDDKKGIANSYGNIGEVYLKQKKINNALEYLSRSLQISEAISDKNGICASYYEIGKTYESSGDHKRAEENFYKSLAVGKEIGDKDAVKDNYHELAGIYFKTNDYRKALEYFENYTLLKDSILNQGNNENMAEMQAGFETERKQKEIELLQKDRNIRELQLSKQEASINRQRIVIYSVIGSLLLVVALIVLILRGNRNRKKTNVGLERKNNEIVSQKDLIEERNKMINDSIDYARTIQNAILPPEEKIKAHFPESFILFLPKDIVSGDFYWLNSDPDKNSCMLATVDCAGHGVPGAFMSVMANSMLENHSGQKNDKPDVILYELNNVVAVLNSDKKRIPYGIDLSMITFDPNKMELQFAGTNSPLIIVSQDKKITEFKPVKAKIGMPGEKFTSTMIKVDKGDMIYLFTDGFMAQKTENQSIDLIKILTSISNCNSHEQKESLQKTFMDWKGTDEQTDDVLVIGARI